LRRAKEYCGDERILGDGDFVNEVLKLSEEELTQELKRQEPTIFHLPRV
jgi:hypothetical protein